MVITKKLILNSIIVILVSILFGLLGGYLYPFFFVFDHTMTFSLTAFIVSSIISLYFLGANYIYASIEDALSLKGFLAYWIGVKERDIRIESIAKLRKFIDVIEECEQDVELICEKGLALMKLHRFEEAIVEFNKGLDTKTEEVSLLCSRGYCKINSEQEEEGLEDIRNAIRINDSYDLAYLYLVEYELLEEERNVENAIRYLDKAIEIKPCTRYYEKRGKLYLELKDYTKAIEDFNNAIYGSEAFSFIYENRNSKRINGYSGYDILMKERDFTKLFSRSYLLFDRPKTSDISIESFINNFVKTFIDSPFSSALYSRGIAKLKYSDMQDYGWSDIKQEGYADIRYSFRFGNSLSTTEYESLSFRYRFDRLSIPSNYTL